MKCCMLLLCLVRKVVRLVFSCCRGKSRVWCDFMLKLSLMCRLKVFGGW